MNDTTLHALDMIEAVEENSNNDIVTNKGISLKGLNYQFIPLNQEQADTLYSVIISDFVSSYDGIVIPMSHTIKAHFNIDQDYTLKLVYTVYAENDVIGRNIIKLYQLDLSDDLNPRLWELIKYAIYYNCNGVYCSEPF